MSVVDETWVQTMAMTTVTLTQEPYASAIDDEDLDDWLAAGAVEAITDAPPWPLEAAVAVLPVPDAERTRAEAVAARQHVSGVPGREAGDGVGTCARWSCSWCSRRGSLPSRTWLRHVHGAASSRC